ncbi:MAG: tetratricopeptide repeat protein [Bacteroidetes bacterium]|nr:tetratricopeptide repeat protein [Bacteroidota bacterium]
MIILSRNDIEQRYRRVAEAVYERRFKSALDEFSQWIRFSTRQEFYYQLETLGDNYRTLLRYAFEGYKDPQQETILKSLSASLLSLADELQHSMREPLLPFHHSEKQILLREFGEDPEQIITSIEEIFLHREVNKLIDAGGNAEDEANNSIPTEMLDKLFKLVWLTEKIKDHHLGLARRINRSGSIEWQEKSLIVSALTLSLLNYFDPQKFILLLEFTEAGEKHVCQRALVGLILGLIKHDRRIANHPELIEKLHSLSRDPEIMKNIEVILLQFLMARETEKITREFEEEVLPDMKKMMPKIEDKLQLGDQTEEIDMEGKNPGWKGMVDEVPGLFEKIEKFSKMQMEGGDVFMSTFQMLKRFDFFNRMCNWFIPFYRQNPESGILFPGNDDLNRRLFDSLEHAFYICNSDKYSFVLNFQAIPAQQRNLIVTNFEAELAQMKDMASEEQMLDQSLGENAIIIQYIQDLYRFFKIYPGRGEFEDIFRKRISFEDLYFYRTFFEQESFTRKLAEFYFEKGHYYEAIDLYEYLSGKGSPSGEFYEKIAFSYQKLGRYKKAVEYYKKAELFDTDRLWILKKLGWCYIRLKDFQSALEYFKEALKVQPADQSLQTQLAQCYLNLKDYEKASQIYAQLLFYSPGNLKFLRPAAYCDFVIGRLTQAEAGYRELLAHTDKLSAYDYMNAGHVYLCQGERKHALELYTKSLASREFTGTAFMDAFDEDVPHMLKYGILSAEIPLIKDYLSFQTERS